MTVPTTRPTSATTIAAGRTMLLAALSSRRAACALIAATCTLIAGCGDDDAARAPVDGSAADEGVDGGEPIDAGCVPETPAPAAAPALTPCPSGWSEVTSDHARAPATCHPWPGDDERPCAAIDEAHDPSDPTCTRVGSPCPAGDWADDLPSGVPILYVHPDADARSATGSRERPFATIDEAERAARDGSVIALSKGTHDGLVTISGAITLWGACVAETLVTLSAPPEPGYATVLTYGVGVAMRNLRVSGNGVAAIAVSGYDVPADVLPTLHLEDVVVAGASSNAIRVEHGATLTARRLVVRDTTTTADPGDDEWGIVVLQHAHADLDRTWIHASSGFGLHVRGGSTARCSDCLVTDTTLPAAGGGVAAFAFDGAELTLERVVLLRNGTGVQTNDATITARDLVVRDPRPSFGQAYGAFANVGAITLERAEIANAMALAIATSAGSRVALTDVFVHDVASRDAELVIDGEVRAEVGSEGAGLLAAAGSELDVTRTVVLRARYLGLLADGPTQIRDGEPSRVALTDTVFAETGATSAALLSGRAIYAQNRAALTLARVEVDGAHEVGIGVDGATLAASDVTIRAIDESVCGECTAVGGIGLGVYREGTSRVDRMLVETTSLAGVHLALGGVAELHDAVVQGTVVGLASDDVVGLDHDASCVAFRDVETAVQAREIAVPEPVESLDQ